MDFKQDGAALFEAIGGAENDELWRFIPLGPFDSAETLIAVLTGLANGLGWLTHVFRDPADGRMLGMATYMNVRADVGAVEVGCVMYSKALQRTPAATEAMFIMAKHLFEDLGYRRYEWKCDNRNDASGSAAERLGFTFEGVFRQDQVVRDENRDTAWYSMLDREWPTLNAGFEKWLAPDNFDASGAQIRSLAELRGC